MLVLKFAGAAFAVSAGFHLWWLMAANAMKRSKGIKT